MTNISKRIIKQILHDKRSIGMIIVVPLMLLTLLYLLLGKSTYVPIVATEELPDFIVSALKEQDSIEVIQKNTNQSKKDFILDGKADAVITQDADGIHITMLEMDSVKMTSVTDSLKTAVTTLNPQSQMNVEFIYGNKDESTFESLGFLLLGIMSFFMIFLFSGISFVRERTSDTIERLMLTPVKIVSVVGGYVLGFGVFAVVQSALMIMYAKFVLKMPFKGEWWCAMIVMLLIAIVAVVMGVLISAISKNEFQVMQFIPIIIVPQMFFSGLIPVDTLPYHLDILSKIMPLYYGAMGLKGILVYGYGISKVLPQIAVLCGFILVFFIANMIVVKKYRAVRS